jgi:hypothetical protein
MTRNAFCKLPVLPGILLVPFILLALLLGGCQPTCPAPEDIDELRDSFGIQFWPEGRIPYKFSDEQGVSLTEDDQEVVEGMMHVWEDAFELDDPAAPGHLLKYIDFWECTDPCQEPEYLNIRYADPPEGNMCDDEWGRIGWHSGITVTLHLERPSHKLGENTTLHELGHCLGLWHEFNREDRDRWLIEGDFCLDGMALRSVRMPKLSNYDYDSVMHYASFTGSRGMTGTLQFVDYHGNAFSRWQLNNYPGSEISPRLKSRTLQYYAYGYQSNWGFFKPLHIPSPTTNTDVLPNPYLDLRPEPDVEAVGTPAIAFQSPDNYDIFARGSNNRLYWMTIRGINRGNWTSLGCCFGSDPSAISRHDGEIDLVAIGAETGRPVYNRYAGGEWSGWIHIQDENPADGIKKASTTDYIGPAIASRDQEKLDVFVVQHDGLLAVTTFEDGTWSAWRSLGRGYNVTARPAAVALSETTVKLAVNERGMYLYEGALSFPPALPAFGLARTAIMAYESPPALATRDDPGVPYRILITNADGRISHKFANGSWRDIGGIPKPGTGPSAVATGRFGALMVINGEDATACDLTCIPGHNPRPDGEYIQPGGLWLREFANEN